MSSLISGLPGAVRAECRDPVVEKLAEGGYSVAKVNIDEQPELAEQYRVMSIPTLIVFKNGKVEDQMVGVQSYQTLEKALQK